MKGYKKYLKIDCIQLKSGKKLYFGTCKLYWYANKYIHAKESFNNNLRKKELKYSFIDLENLNYPFSDFNECKKVLRKLFLLKIKEIKSERNAKVMKKFKVWP